MCYKGATFAITEGGLHGLASLNCLPAQKWAMSNIVTKIKENCQKVAEKECERPSLLAASSICKLLTQPPVMYYIKNVQHATSTYCIAFQYSTVVLGCARGAWMYTMWSMVCVVCKNERDPIAKVKIHKPNDIYLNLDIPNPQVTMGLKMFTLHHVTFRS